jgi:hypothetical protein
MMEQPVIITDEIKQEVEKIANKVNPELRQKFDDLYNEWLVFRNSPKIRLLSNPRGYCKTQAFTDIVELGMEVVPLLMNKIAQGDFFSLQAVEEIKKKESSPEKYFGLTSTEAMSEQSRAALVLLGWYGCQNKIIF